MQLTTKVIDVTRSFVPVDPNAYPETLHGTDAEDKPENRVPAIVYMGHNFIPTAHGVKSFFGTNSVIGARKLAPNKPDYIFVFQTLTYKNVLIALCDTGIWVNTVSAEDEEWVQLVEKDAPAADNYYEWWYTAIRNKLYLFRANDTNFYEIATDITEAIGISVTEKDATFITLSSQLGMFSVGSRLGFWDGNNAIAYSSADDVSDFEPKVLTGANVTTFNSVVGKISSIRRHGKHAIIYASKSITLLEVQAGDSFLLKASPIVVGAGVPYNKQAVSAVPDTTHFAYTTTGIFKIENAQPEAIVPQVYDYLKTYTEYPVYLRLLQGRFLCFELIEGQALNKPQFTEESISESSVLFPGVPGSLEEIKGSSGLDQCLVLPQLTNNFFQEQQDQAAADVPVGNRMPGTFVEPLYTCYFCNKGVKDISNITWEVSPCGATSLHGEEWAMSPGSAGVKLSDMNTDTGPDKLASAGTDAWVDGKWTMQRFVQFQSAIWKAEEKVLQQFLAQITQRAFYDVKNTEAVASCAIVAPSHSYCDLGTYVSRFSDYQFGYNVCSFWLTRYALETKTFNTRTTNETACTPVPTNVPLSGWYLVQNGTVVTGTLHADAMAACDAWNYYEQAHSGQLIPDVTVTLSGVGSGTSTGTMCYRVVDASGDPITTPSGANGAIPVFLYDVNPLASYSSTAGSTTGGVLLLPKITEETTTKVETRAARNVITDTDTGVLGVESAVCLLTHWRYTDTNGQTQIVPASTCTNTEDSYPQSTELVRAVDSDANRPNLLNSEGALCGQPFEVPDLIDYDIGWPGQEVVYPGLSWLLQDGSNSPKYPTFAGALVYDLHLKKWGKAKLEYKQLLDYLPVNSDVPRVLGADNEGIMACAYKDDGYLYVLDSKPQDSEVAYGKLGYYRQGMTNLNSVRVDFASNSSGHIDIEVSLDGQKVATPLTTEHAFGGTRAIVHPPYSGKWFNVWIRGIYDINFMSVEWAKSSRR